MAGWGLLARWVSPTSFPGPGCCSSLLGGVEMIGQAQRGRKAPGARMAGAELLTARRAARAPWACSPAAGSRGDRSRRKPSLAPQLDLRVHPRQGPGCRWATGGARGDSRQSGPGCMDGQSLRAPERPGAWPSGLAIPVAPYVRTDHLGLWHSGRSFRAHPPHSWGRCATLLAGGRLWGRWAPCRTTGGWGGHKERARDGRATCSSEWRWRGRVRPRWSLTGACRPLRGSGGLQRGSRCSCFCIDPRLR